MRKGNSQDVGDFSNSYKFSIPERHAAANLIDYLQSMLLRRSQVNLELLGVDLK
jgi:hypothetical protein